MPRPLLALLLLSMLASAPDASAQSTAPAHAIDSLMSDYARPDGPGAAIVVIRDGRIAFIKGYGLADVEARVPVTPETDFRLASLTKQFTATAIMLLAADGKLRYDEPIARILPDLPSWASTVTVRELLDHTSGLPDYEDFVPDTQTAQVHDADIPALIAHASGTKFPPGTQYAYSNTGYVLLGLIVERVSGQSFPDFLHRRIFAPLHMTGTLAHVDGRDTIPHRAWGYTIDSAGVVRRTDQSNTSATLGDGGVYTSVRDLVQWDRALERHTLVSAAAQQLAWTPPALPAGHTTEYGFGWFIDRDRGAVRQSHHGESMGFTNAIFRYPAQRLTVIVLTNRTGGAPWDAAQRITDLWLDPVLGKGTTPKPPFVSP